MKTLHILNGDAILSRFKKANLAGDLLVWREMMCEGKLPPDTTDPSFWTLRYKHLQEVYGLDAGDYDNKVIREFRKLTQLSNYEEVVCWFEFDLFCQVNLIFLLQAIYQHAWQDRLIFLVSLDQPSLGFGKGLGQPSSTQLKAFFLQRQPLEENDLKLATDAWHAYTSDDPSRILQLFEDTDFGHLGQLRLALQAHLMRLPSRKNGLNRVQQFLLSSIIRGLDEQRLLMRKFHEEMSIYGFGDFQIKFYLLQMIRAGILVENKYLQVTEKGKQVWENELDFVHLIQGMDYWLGGIHLPTTRWRWLGEAHSIVKI